MHLLLRLDDARYATGDLAGSLVPFLRTQAVIESELARGETLAWLARRGEAAWEVSGTLEETDPRRHWASRGPARRQCCASSSYGPDAHAEKWLAILFNQQSQLLVDLAEAAAAIDPATHALAIREPRARLEPDDPRRQRDLAIGRGSAAGIFAKAARRSDACALARRALASWDAIQARDPVRTARCGEEPAHARTRIGQLCRS